jgi:hypothetical protein
MKNIKNAIKMDKFELYEDSFLRQYYSGDIDFK